MSGWAQREAERKEDEANEMDELITENRELTAERDQLAAHVERLREALRKIMVGGNHLASALIHILGAGDDSFPPHQTPIEQVRGVITDPVHMDLWTCWAVIMRERYILAATPAQFLAAHDAAIKVAVLREMRNRMYYAQTWDQIANMLTDEADRIEKESANA